MKVNQRSITSELFRRRVDRLVFVCSHPHSDHLQGLIRLVSSDTNIKKFKNIAFVDSGYPEREGGGPKRLITHYRTGVIGKDFSAPRPEYFSTRRKNAFATISKATDNVVVQNFVYSQENLNSGIHGESIILNITLQDESQSLRIVDFDDAKDDLVNRWIEWAKEDLANRKPSVLVLPHHGSTSNNIDNLLTNPLRPSSIIISANSNNRFLHPAAKNLAKSFGVVGIQNVYIIGADGNIHIFPSGVQVRRKQDRHLSFLRELLRRQKARHVDRADKLEKTMRSEARRADELKERFEREIASIETIESLEGLLEEVAPKSPWINTESPVVSELEKEVVRKILEEDRLKQ